MHAPAAVVAATATAWPTVATAVVSAVAVAACMVALVMMCLGGDRKANQTPTTESFTTRRSSLSLQDAQLEDHDRRTSMIAMEGNPLYAGKRQPAAVVDIDAAMASGPHDDADVDEDEMANQAMGANMTERRRTGTLTAIDKPSIFRLQQGSTPWLHYQLRKPEAEQLLREQLSQSQEEGIFLVRAKKPQDGLYVLDVAWRRGNDIVVESHPITRSQAGGYLLDDQSYDRHMELEDLVRYLSKPRNKAFHKALTLFVAASSQDTPKSMPSAAC